MFIDELTKIRESEADAEQLIRDARQSSRKGLEEARANASKILSEAEGRAKDIYDSLIAAGEKKSAKEYDDFLRKAESDSAAMIEKARKNKAKAVDFIAERIVSASVSR